MLPQQNVERQTGAHYEKLDEKKGLDGNIYKSRRNFTWQLTKKFPNE